MIRLACFLLVAASSSAARIVGTPGPAPVIAPPGTPTFQIFVKRLDGKTVTINDVDPQMTVGELAATPEFTRKVLRLGRGPGMAPDEIDLFLRGGGGPCRARPRWACWALPRSRRFLQG